MERRLIICLNMIVRKRDLVRLGINCIFRENVAAKRTGKSGTRLYNILTVNGA